MSDLLNKLFLNPSANAGGSAQLRTNVLGASTVDNSPSYYRPGGNPTSQYNGQMPKSGSSSGGGSKSGGNNNVPVPAPAGGNNNAPSQPDYNSMISELYDPAIRIANEQESNIRTGYDQDRTNLLNRVAQSLGEYETQGNQLLQDTDVEQNNFNKTLESAFAQAVRAFNALNQRGNVIYGGGSSTGKAMGELAAREFYRQQGAVQNKQAEGNEQFAIERGKIKQYVDSKKKDLDMYKQEALDSLEQNMKDKLNAIATKKYEIEANRTRDKMSVLQSAIESTRAINEQDKQFRRELAMASINQMQQISGRVFTPAEIKAYMSEFESDFNMTPGTDSQASALTQIISKPKSYKDEFNTLNPTASQQTQNTQQIASSVPYTNNNSSSLLSRYLM